MWFLKTWLLLLVFHASSAQAVSQESDDALWLGWGLSQTEAFWADRAPMVPKWHLQYEKETSWVVAPNSAWESPLRLALGKRHHQFR